MPDSVVTLPQSAHSAAQRALWRYRKALLSVTLLIVGGTVGYMWIEGWNAFDAFSMTVSTIATVGYTTVHPLSHDGVLFTSLLILFGVGTVGYAFSLVAAGVVEGEIGRAREVRKMEKLIEKLANHTIICGYGRLARITVRELITAGEAVIVIEANPELAQAIASAGASYVIGSAYEDETLSRARVGHAKTLVTLLPNDADNVYVTLCARDLNPTIQIIARSDGGAGEKKLIRAGANRIISPYRVAGVGLVQRLTRPHVSEFLEIASTKSGDHLALEEVVVPASSPLAGKLLEACELRAKTGAIIAAIIEPEGTMMLSPDGGTVIQGGSTLIVLGKPGSLDRLATLL